MVERKGRYILAAFITGLIFTLGLLAGLVVENERIGYVNNQFHENRVELNSAQVQYDILATIIDEESCSGVTESYYDSLSKLGQVQERLESYQQSQSRARNEFELLQREYVIEQTRYWLLAEKLISSCDQDIITILYFYGPEDECPSCSDQEIVLSYYKQLFKNKLLIFSFDGDQVAEPVVNILKNVYEIEQFPTLIVSSEKFDQYQDKDALGELLCDTYTVEDAVTREVCAEFDTASNKTE